MLVQEPVQAAIWHCLNHYDHKDAVFLAERLCIEVESDETIFLLATSYYRSNLIHQTYWLLREKARRSPQCRFLLAKSAYTLKKYTEAENALIQNGFIGDINSILDDIVKEFGEIACFALQLIAQICIKTERSKLAVAALGKALKLNPFMWQAYADLCHLGEYPDGNSIFKITNTDIFNTCHGNINTSPMVLLQACQILEGNINNMSFGNSGNNSSNSVNGDNDVNQLSNNSNNIYTTPVDQPIPLSMAKGVHTLSTVQNNVTTPSQNQTNNNNCSLNNTISLLRGSDNNSNNLNAISHNENNTTMLEETPFSGNNNSNGSGNSGDNGLTFRKPFKYLSITPTFGVMPITSPMSGINHDSSFVLGGCCNNISVLNTSMTSMPSPQTIAEMKQEYKIITKKNINHLINRKSSSIIESGGGVGGGNIGVGGGNSVGTNRPVVFSQAGNTTPRSSNNVNLIGTGSSMPNTPVRRSSRLFGNTAYSVKENTKSPNIANKLSQLRSPPRKTKNGRTGKICLSNELIEDKSSGVTTISSGNQGITEKLNEKNFIKKDKDKVETITSTTTTTNGNSSGNNCNRSTIIDHETKVQLNNNLNNAQTLTNHLMSLKKQSADGLMNLLRDLSEGYKQMVHFQCKAAIRHFESVIPKNHLCSSWVQSLIGMCYYELKEYETAVMIFKQIHEQDPHRLDFMEIYSSSLWHLQRDVDLSALAQDLINQDKMSPITWCVAGNCFSLHKEHETAIKFFKRAIQVDTDFVYSYTLLGHELVLTEELDKAMEYFRAAVVRDPRHYNAWFGIGTIYSKQEKYELAELHYIKALKINSQNSVIMVHIGAMQYFMQKKEQAMRTLDTAVIIDPKNPLARFHRGSVYFSLGKHQEALCELEELKELVPKESVVFYLIGKIYKTLGNVDLALMHFSWATDLDPKGANNQVKDAFDSMSNTNVCTALNEPTLIDPTDLGQIAERSETLTQSQSSINYDSDY